MKHSLDDTIAAIATPLGVGGIGVVRLSGPQARQIASALFDGKTPSQAWESHRIYHGWIVASGDKVDEVLLSYMAAPNSYTGEDVVEISCHGGGLVLKRLLDLLVKQGARLAERGEFTKRAFLSGRLDLLKAEAVADLISAKSERGLRSAAAQLGGVISAAVTGVRQKLLDLVSALEASIDYPDDLEPPGQEAIRHCLTESAAGVDNLLATAEEGRLVREGVRLAIVGKPNVGKSSLLNRLMEADRAIVSEVPGTTRDTIEEGVAINGLSFVLVDTAGIRSPNDRLEAEGINRAAAEIGRADLVMIVLDASSALSAEDERVLSEARGRRLVIALNKADLGMRLDLNGELEGVDKFRVSALTGEGIGGLREGLVAAVFGGLSGMGGSPALINARHKEALQRAKEALRRASATLAEGAEPDLLPIDLKAAIAALGEMTGQEVSDEIVENIFRRFCVGK